jgi:hypothetical protein
LKTTKCPACGAVLEVSIVLGTDYTKTKQILESKASGAELTNQQLDSLKWKQSTKREALSTILVNESVLGVPIARLLYDRLKASASFSWKLEQTTYKLSTFEGKEFLQRWQPLK